MHLHTSDPFGNLQIAQWHVGSCIRPRIGCFASPAWLQPCAPVRWRMADASWNRAPGVVSVMAVRPTLECNETPRLLEEGGLVEGVLNRY